MVIEVAGWNLKSGEISEYYVSEERYWSLFNFVFSDGSRKRNSYKFGFIKSMLDNLFNGSETDQGIYFTYEQLFAKFAENYWNLVVKYDLRQMRKDLRSEFSKIETILQSAVATNSVLEKLEFASIDAYQRNSIIKQVKVECKKCVVGALYEDFEGTLYSFDLKADGLYVAPSAYEFMLKYKMEIEKLNYYSWAKFLEKINSDNVLIRVIDKLELATPKRANLSIYRNILLKEFEECNCFYCGRRFQRSRSAHVDHFIPWSFVKDDRIWNFVLSCPQCNVKKSNRIPAREYIIRIENRNRIICQNNNDLIQAEFDGYTDNLIDRMWKYAKMSGIKEYNEFPTRRLSENNRQAALEQSKKYAD